MQQLSDVGTKVSVCLQAENSKTYLNRKTIRILMWMENVRPVMVVLLGARRLKRIDDDNNDRT